MAVHPTRTTCPYCGVGCGVLVEQTADGAVSVKGDPDHPANLGKLCSKGSALGETLGSEERLLQPMINGVAAGWDQATQTIADKFNQVIADHGPDAVALYLSGQILTEDYYIANKLMKGYVGTANVDTNSRLCMASSVVGHKRAFGADTVPGNYEDLEQADLVVLVGSNLAWCHPILFQRIRAAKEARPDMRLVVIDPRRTATCDLADLHLPIKPGGDVALFTGLLHALDKRGAVDHAFVSAHTNDVSKALAASAFFNLDVTSDLTGIAQDDLAKFFRWVAQTEKTVTVYSQGVNQAKDGTDKVNAIINAHLLTGRIGRPGMGPFSVTGQPNAMGGREVGGLANQLASHMDIANPAHRDLVQRYWNAPTMADHEGLKAVDLFDAIHDGKVKAVWIMGTNPVVSLPEADKVKEALRRCELVVVSDMTANTDTAQLADILLPAATWGEKEGMVTNSERRMSRQRAFLPLPGQARADWRQIRDVAHAMGFVDGFAFDTAYDVFQDYVGLCSFENDEADGILRDLDLGGLLGQTADQYDAFKPQQWPVYKDGSSAARLFGNGGFFTPDGKARFVVAQDAKPDKVPAGKYHLNSGRVRDHWHTLTRTGLSTRLSAHIAEPFVEISPEDAMREQVRLAEIVQVESAHGTMLARALVTDRQKPGQLFAPMHWTDAYASAGRVDAVMAAETDPFSGQPALKSGRVSLARFAADWYGFAIIRADLLAAVRPKCAYWAKARIDGGARVELAGKGAFDLSRLGFADGAAWQTYDDGQNRRFALYDGDDLQALVFVAERPVAVARDWAAQLLSRPIPAGERLAILAGRAGAGAPDKGMIICSCMQVGTNDLKQAVKAGACSIDALGEATGAGTNCGSCRSELAQFLPTKEATAA
ncbi:MAG: nitrate reductase [Alphaproteobacteria bacterium]